MHHAWILAGPKGVGKASFAYAAAAQLVAEPGVPQPEIEAHPDILIPRHPPPPRRMRKSVMKACRITSSARSRWMRSAPCNAA
jgi:DNA polymerase III delta prime subunit